MPSPNSQFEISIKYNKYDGDFGNHLIMKKTEELKWKFVGDTFL